MARGMRRGRGHEKEVVLTWTVEEMMECTQTFTRKRTEQGIQKGLRKEILKAPPLQQPTQRDSIIAFDTESDQEVVLLGKPFLSAPEHAHAFARSKARGGRADQYARTRTHTHLKHQDSRLRRASQGTRTRRGRDSPSLPLDYFSFYFLIYVYGAWLGGSGATGAGQGGLESGAVAEAGGVGVGMSCPVIVYPADGSVLGEEDSLHVTLSALACPKAAGVLPLLQLLMLLRYCFFCCFSCCLTPSCRVCSGRYCDGVSQLGGAW
jgi:hypothetical protein